MYIIIYIYIYIHLYNVNIGECFVRSENKPLVYFRENFTAKAFV